MKINIEFRNIRGQTPEGQRSAFEQLVCHLAQINGGTRGFRRIDGAGGDGGVEALHILPSGRKIGYQAKFYLHRDSIDWKKIDNSVKTALTQHPELERYIIALPCDFTGTRAARGGKTQGLWGTWDKQVENWKALENQQGIDVIFEPWTAFELEAALLKPNALHLLHFFFDQLVFTREWMQRHLDRTVKDLQARYSPDEHVETESLKPFDVIFRRANVCQDLQTVFNVARQSNLRSAVALVENANIPEADLVRVEKSRMEFLNLAESVNWTFDKEWPILKWLTSWHSFTRQLMELNHTIGDRIQTENILEHDTLRRKIYEETKVYDLTTPEVFGGNKWARHLPIDASRALLFVGRAGAGKSHVLARGAEIAWYSGAPVIHVLGQHILDNDPRQSILNNLELPHWTFQSLLSALNLAAEAADTRGLLVIDALNEGNGIDIWKKHLASFIHEVNAHDRIVLIVSCRGDYLEYIVPQEIIAEPRVYPDKNGNPPRDCRPLGKFVRISVDGFQTSEEREAALQKFMDAKGISRPTAPVLDKEFFNPLFMSSVCRAMAKAGIKVFPRGLHGAREIFAFVLETKSRALGTRHDGIKQVHSALLAALSELAGFMVMQKSDSVPLSDAIHLVNSAFMALPISTQTWLAVLEASEILRRDVEKKQNIEGPWGKPNEVIRFSFQRLQDNLIAERLFVECQEIEHAFEPDAPFAFLVKRSIRIDGITELEPTPRWVGVLGALWSLVAEKRKIELWDVQSFFGSQEVDFYAHDFRPIFFTSIRERPCNSFTQSTRNILNRLWQDMPEEKLAIFLSTACVPSHAWNADFISERLFSFKLSERDSVWSRFFVNNSYKLFEQVSQIINWALNVDAKVADDEVVRLAGITLTWLLTVTNRIIRDRATKSLVNLQIGKPTLFPYLMDKFRTIDDVYVLERLLASGYGAICHDPSNKRLKTAAKAVADVIFGSTEPPVHLSIRDWARLILERAAERKQAPKEFDMDKVRLPFGSAPPMFNVSKDDLEAIAALAGDNTIARSCQIDYFYIEEIKLAVCDFSEILITNLPPLTKEERAYRFEASVYEVGGIAEVRLNSLLSVLKSQNFTKEMIDRFETAFINSLPKALKKAYATELAPKIHRTFQPPETRNSEPAGLWIGRRAYELGWTKERFPDEPYSSDRRRPVIERIGKKYQWIALEELMARLADNFWIKASFYGKGTRIYQCRQDAWIRDRIDPTIFPPKEDNQSFTTKSFIEPPQLLIEEIDDTELEEWPFRADHFDNPEPWLTGFLDGRPCLIAGWTESINEDCLANNSSVSFRRQVQAFVSLVAHKIGDRQKVINGFLTNHNGGIDHWSLEDKPEGFLAHEFSLMSSDEIPLMKPTIYGNTEIAAPILSIYLDEDMDCSIKGSIEYAVPHPRIQQALGLRMPDPRNGGLWLLPDEKIFLIKLKGRGEPLLLDKERFDEWCCSEGLEYSWVYIGERTAWESLDAAKLRRTLGVAWYEKGKICFENKQRDQ